MRRKFWSVLLCLALGLGLLSVTAGAVVEPTEAFYVADYADVLSADTEQYIIDKNQTLFDTTGGQIVVVTVEFMDGMDSADYAMQVVENWGGIGDVDRDNGFLLVYAVGENKVWAMTGSGLEDALPASQIERYLEEYFYDDYDAQSYDRGTRDFFDAIYAWYESYYAGSAGGGEQDFHYYPEAEPDYVHGYVGSVFGFGVFGLMGLIILLVILACLTDGIRYRRYRRRYLMPGMPPPPYVYRPFIFGRPHRPRPPRPPMGGGFRSGGSFRGGGAGRSGGGFRSSGAGRSGGAGRRGGGFRSGGGFRGGGAGRR